MFPLVSIEVTLFPLPIVRLLLGICKSADIVILGADVVVSITNKLLVESLIEKACVLLSITVILLELVKSIEDKVNLLVILTSPLN